MVMKFLRKLFSRRVTERTSTDTEFTAETVRIREIKPHGNADKLELAFFDLKTGPATYQVVIQKGQYAVGDLVNYFSVDCLLPTSHPAFKFLTERLDGANKAVYRLRAARLRGQFSQGLLVPLDRVRQLGEFVAPAYGVTYHSTPEEGQPTQPGKTKAKRQLMPVYAVDSLKKLPNLFQPGELVYITEKIHGTNFRFGWVPRKVLGIRFGYKFVFGSHRAMKGEGSPGYYKEDVWRSAVQAMQLADRTKRYPGHIFYGELYGYTYSGQRIQDLTYGRTPTSGPGLAIFDIKTPKGWMDALERQTTCIDILGLPVVPMLGVTGFDAESVRQMAEGKSTLDSKQIREGVVVESLTDRRKAKYVGEGYLTRKDA